MLDRELAEKIKDILDDKKGIDVTVVDISGKTILADYFVIASGSSRPHIRSLVEEVEQVMAKEHGIRPIRTEGAGSNSWVLIDYGPVIVHVFHKEQREFYSLERLWEGLSRVDE